jgi:hypothetical protein
MRYPATTTIIRETLLEDGTVTGEFEIEIEGTYYPGRAATYLDPPEYPEAEILSATIDGEETELTEEEEERAKDKILSDPPENPHYSEY